MRQVAPAAADPATFEPHFGLPEELWATSET